MKLRFIEGTSTSHVGCDRDPRQLLFFASGSPAIWKQWPGWRQESGLCGLHSTEDFARGPCRLRRESVSEVPAAGNGSVALRECRPTPTWVVTVRCSKTPFARRRVPAAGAGGGRPRGVAFHGRRRNRSAVEGRRARRVRQPGTNPGASTGRARRSAGWRQRPRRLGGVVVALAGRSLCSKAPRSQSATAFDTGGGGQPGE